MSPSSPRPSAGRGLGIALLPPGLEQLAESERTTLPRRRCRPRRHAPPQRHATDQAKQAIIMQALRVLAESGTRPTSASTISSNSSPPKTGPARASQPRRPQALQKTRREHLQTTVHMRGEVLAKAKDTLSAELLFGLGFARHPGKPASPHLHQIPRRRRSPSCSGLSQLLLELTRFASRTPSPTLQAAVMFDEADIYCRQLRSLRRRRTRKSAQEGTIRGDLGDARDAESGGILTTSAARMCGTGS